MNAQDEITDLIRRAMVNIEHEKIGLGELPPEYKELGDTVCQLLKQVQELCRFVGDMADGGFDTKVPPRGNYLAGSAKDLYYKFRHLTWQAEQVAHGDYSQHVDFMGEFSVSFNTMINDLRLREQTIRENAEAQVREAQERNVRLERQMARQLARYHSYCGYVKSFFVFREQYQKMMGEVYGLFNDGKYTQGRMLIAEINEAMNRQIVVHRQYSNNEFVNAALTDMADVCLDQKIPFEFLVHIPDGMAMECHAAMNMLSIVTELLLAMIDARKDRERQLSARSSEKGSWLTVIFRYTADAAGELITGREGKRGECASMAEELGAIARENDILFDIKPEAGDRCVMISFHASRRDSLSSGQPAQTKERDLYTS